MPPDELAAWLHRVDGMRFRKILCPIDFSAGSAHAMRMAVQLAKESRGPLVLMHAMFIPATSYAGGYALPPTYLQDITGDAQRGLDEAVREAVQLGAPAVTAKLVSGRPWTPVVEELTDPTYDLVVTGTHGRTGIARVLLGSVAEKIVRHAPCSVLVVRPDTAIGPFQNLLCPIDFSPCSRPVIELAAEMAVPGGRRITLLHVLDLPVAYSGEPSALGFIRDLDQQSAAAIEQWASQLGPRTPATIATRTRIGHPGAQTLHMLDQDPSIDLVIVGSHGRTGLSRALLGSVAEKLVRHARCPVLVARVRA